MLSSVFSLALSSLTIRSFTDSCTEGKLRIPKIRVIIPMIIPKRLKNMYLNRFMVVFLYFTQKYKKQVEYLCLFADLN